MTFYRKRKFLLPVAVAMVFPLAAVAADMPQAKMSPAARIAFETAHSRRNLPALEAETPYVNAFVTVSDGFDMEALAGLGVRTGARAGDILTARIPCGSLPQVAELPGVVYIDVADKVTPMMDVAREEAGVPYEVSMSGRPEFTVTGNGVVVGVIDRGFDYTHEAFLGADGVCRISRVWEQAETSGEYPSPEPFGYGAEFTLPEEIAAAAGDIAGNSHGTHVAGIAAGNSAYRDGLYSGVAPGAEIVLVSMDVTEGDSSHLADAISYIFSYAEEAGKPCVINMSLGTQVGPHDGTSSFDRMADALSGGGRLLVGSAGNHGSDKFHVSGTFSGADDTPLGTFIDFKTAPGAGNTGGTVDIWGDPDLGYRVELVSYSGGKKAVDESLEVNMESADAVDYVFGRNVEGPLSVAVERNPVNGKLHVMIKSGVTSVRSRYYVGIRVIPETAGMVDIWADNIQLGLTDNDVDGYTCPDNTCSTIAEIGGTAESVLTVGAYTTRDKYSIAGSTDIMEIGQTAGDICSFSSSGPTADGRQKPEITAPGCFIISAVSSHDNSGSQILADVNEDGGYRYGYMQGTSMSAPFVTGVVAGWLEIDPTLDPERLKMVAAESARTDAYTASGSASVWGAGKINPEGGAVWLLANGLPDISEDGRDPVILPGQIIFPAGGRAEVSVADVGGRTVRSVVTEVRDGETFGLTRQALNLEPGIYIVRASGKSGSVIAKVRL